MELDINDPLVQRAWAELDEVDAKVGIDPEMFPLPDEKELRRRFMKAAADSYETEPSFTVLPQRKSRPKSRRSSIWSGLAGYAATMGYGYVGDGVEAPKPPVRDWTRGGPKRITVGGKPVHSYLADCRCETCRSRIAGRFNTMREARDYGANCCECQKMIYREEVA